MFLTAVNEGLINVDNSIQVGLRTHNELDVGIEVIDVRYCLLYTSDAADD